MTYPDTTCHCHPPVLSLIRDVLVSRKPKANGKLTIDRYYDCMFHGPCQQRMEVFTYRPEHGYFWAARPQGTERSRKMVKARRKHGNA